MLHRIIFNTRGAVNNTLVIYDTTAGSGTIIATIDTTNANLNVLEYRLLFSTGLTLVSATGTGANITVVYE